MIRPREAGRMAAAATVALAAAAVSTCGGAATSPAADAATACPVAVCAARFRELLVGCPTTGVACTTTTEQIQVNDCFANGVRVDFDYRSDGDFDRASVLRADGRICYQVAAADQLEGTVFTVSDPAGGVVLREYVRPGLASTFACPDGATLVDGPEHPCGELRAIPDDSACASGLCLRP